MPSPPSSAAIALAFLLVLVGQPAVAVVLCVLALAFECLLFYAAGSD